MKSTFFRVYYILAFFVVLCNAVYHVKTNLLPDIEDLPVGRQLYTSEAPDGSVRLEVYQVKNAIGSAVRISAVDLTSGDVRNVYWQTEKETVDIIWQNSDEIAVDEMPLNVKLGGYYDCRRGRSIVLSGSLFSKEDE